MGLKQLHLMWQNPGVIPARGEASFLQGHGDTKNYLAKLMVHRGPDSKRKTKPCWNLKAQIAPWMNVGRSWMNKEELRDPLNENQEQFFIWAQHPRAGVTEFIKGY